MNDWYEFYESVTQYMGGSAYLGTALKTAAALAAAIIANWIFKRIMRKVERKNHQSTSLKIDPSVLNVVKKLFLIGVMLITGVYLIRLYELFALERVFYAIIILLTALPIKNFFLVAIKYYKHNLAHKTETKIDDIAFDLLNRFTGIGTIVIAIILALDIMGINVMPFIAGAGVAGIAIGFAAKDTLSNLIAGVLLIIDRPFEINDRIEVWSAPSGSATWGDVIDIGIRATKIRTTDNIVIIIPNNEIMKRDIINYTISSSHIRVRINIGVAYEADIEKAKKAIAHVAGSLPWVLQEPEPKVVVVNFGESAIDLQLRVWIKDARKRIDTISTITDQVKTAFDKEGVEIPYPKRDILVTYKDNSAEKQI